MFSELINFQNEGHECQCQCGSCKNNEQCQKSCSCPTGCNSDDKCPCGNKSEETKKSCCSGK
ncbi:AQG_2a_G0024270.mRNA.1.CDS.1 [Saccharomyces cerevisiae]|uniref:Copper metallothionein 1-1 n=7 Tax=Saccharomyces cerevisiae TaxID=4932 RepID=MTCU1_YEAST|nr:metallothionein CUP1 [Saccharomyces cerevisiae S288C]NP_011922.1 metallothionein CUP1 [Saccharomyces cerevisiae S288C]P0CX80.1 RecName: Full=Copper metallothionein 1-1; Short=Cu-MT; Short=Cu-metallothionein; AltName: Full=Copper chelatin; AltName: Full=Copper thionein; Flags: Precursor [Saccharomyces cerevisiae S288C]P0CX81.1 RecName: Full=Copper metallothionein 1-2; Short=Cu-MT; Short=Cu-metallothionein; AltName: Full=Copper chelatin; AltName: Full=Copper thionein; Flags: Precursor [Saccharo|eukprot:NP_011920.1 metallothionein CUP1 [Saccharomyces cerevisiae S288C]